MQTSNRRPIPQLQPYVKNIWVLDCRQAHLGERMIPYGCMDMVYVEQSAVVYRNHQTRQFVQNEVFLTGQVTQPYTFDYKTNTTIIGFGFYPHTAHLFTQLPAHILTDDICCLSDIFPTRILLDRLSGLEGINAKINLLENFLWRKIQLKLSNDRKQGYLRYLLQQIFRHKGYFDGLKAQKELNISRRYIQALFKEYVGVNPILYAKIVRFLNAINNYEETQLMTLTHLALDSGYYDQSHFIRDCKRFTGLSPKQYFKTPTAFLDQFTNDTSSSLLYNSIPER